MNLKQKKILENMMSRLKKEDIINDENVCKVRWDYNQGLDEDIIADILEKTSSKSNFYSKFEEDYRNIYFETLDSIVEYVNDNILTENDKEILDSNEENLPYEYISENITVDYNLEELLENTDVIVTSTIVDKQCEYIEDQMYDLEYMFDIETYDGLLYEFPDKDTLNKLSLEKDEYNVFNSIDYLCKTQGYKLADLHSKEKCEKSVFLRTLNDEIWEQIHDTSLVITNKINAKDYINLLFSNKDTMITFKNDSSIKVGLFDCVNGGGSLMGIELEKPINVPRENLIVAGPGRNEGYTFENVYGTGLMERYNNSLIIGKEPYKEIKNFDVDQYIQDVKELGLDVERELI